MDFLTTDLKKNAWLKHGFFTRMGGVSGGLYTSLNCGLKTEDEKASVMENRARVAEALGVEPERLLIAKQVHGTKVSVVTRGFDASHAPEVDALVTDKPNTALGVLTADCAPVLFADKRKKIIGAAHAGWRGALAGVLEATVEAMKELGSRAGDIETAIGPCIGPTSYEVQTDFRDAFLEQDKKNASFFRPSPRAGHLLFDLPGYCKNRLSLAGIKTTHVVQYDTLSGEAMFFSNRRAFLRSEKSFGLQVSAISIASEE